MKIIKNALLGLCLFNLHQFQAGTAKEQGKQKAAYRKKVVVAAGICIACALGCYGVKKFCSKEIPAFEGLKDPISFKDFIKQHTGKETLSSSDAELCQLIEQLSQNAEQLETFLHFYWHEVNSIRHYEAPLLKKWKDGEYEVMVINDETTILRDYYNKVCILLDSTARILSPERLKKLDKTSANYEEIIKKASDNALFIIKSILSRKTFCNNEAQLMHRIQELEGRIAEMKAKE